MFNIQASQEMNSGQVVPESDLLTTLVEMEGIEDLLVSHNDIPTSINETIISSAGPMIGSSNLVQSMDSMIGLESNLGIGGDMIMMDTTMGSIDTTMAPLMSHQAQAMPRPSSIVSPPMSIAGESIVQPIFAQVSTNPMMHVASGSMDNVVENKTATILPGKIINAAQPTMSTLQPLKISGAQPILINQVLGTNVQFHGGNISYILPTPNTLAKQTVVTSKSSPIQMSTTLNNVNMASSTLISNTGATIINPMAKKVIQTSQALVMSPIKQSTPVKSNTSMPQQTIAIKSSGKPTVVSNFAPEVSKTNLAATFVPVSTSQAVSTSQPQQQQLIILSPMKSTNQTAKQIIPSIKIMQSNPKLPTIAPAPAKRVIAPAPVAPKTSVTATTSTNAGKQMPFISNKNVQFISLVPASSATQLSTGTKLVPLKPSTPTKPTSANQVTNVKPNMVHVGQKLLFNSNSIKFSSNTSASTVMVNSSSATANNQQNAGKRSQPSQIWMIPKNLMSKVNENSAAQLATKSTAKYVPIAPNPNQSSNLNDSQRLSSNFSKFQPTLMNSGSTENFEETRRKPCNCTRSQCLKLYCDCFANGEFCNNCNCVSCCNNLMHEEIRQKAIRLCLERNPNAFHPKIGQAAQSGDERRHTKGCCCKRSGCLKNYCECYEAKILCSNKCKCVGCKNFEESTERKTLMHLADAAEVRSAQQSVATKLHIWGPDLKPKLPVKVKSDCPPFNVFTMDILEATASCLFSQGEEGEYENSNEENIESLIFEQFGECLSQILSLANNGIADDAMEGNSDDEDNLPSELEIC